MWFITFFGRTAPAKLETTHGCQFLDDRAKAGAPIGANKDMALMSTMCNHWIRWGLIKTNPFVGMMQNKSAKDVRAIERHQVLCIYIWSLPHDQAFLTILLDAGHSARRYYNEARESRC
ncbi:hypothetical protein BSFP_002910 [Burkholderia stabilis]|uniref:Uncharacterized protein n=1 Tax=Burkholderia stabilis TaxID=95485 RepID=A0A1Y1BGP4_9BURK|nr:hypothetical protein BSFP_002910 [Burkholderia stabilis]